MGFAGVRPPAFPMKTGLNVQVARQATRAELDEWYEKQGLKPDKDGIFTSMPYSDAPVSRDAILSQVEQNSLRRDVPNLAPREYTPKIMVYVGGGPTIKCLLDEIRAKCEDDRYDVFTSNKTASYLLSHGIRPDYHIIVDPTEKKAKDIEYDADVPLVLGLQCHPALFDKAKSLGRKVTKFLAASITNDDGKNDRDAAREAAYPADPFLLGIGGGSMCGTRMLYFASARGYRRLEFYGVDGSIEYAENGAVNCYAYFKPRGENIIETEASNGRKFFSTISLARQAEELVQMMDLLPGMDVEVYGESLMSNQLAMYKELRKGATYRISPAYLELQREMHATRHYGTHGSQHAARVFMAAAQLHRKHGSCSVLDYGSGPGLLTEAIERCFPDIPQLSYYEYDPAFAGKDANPSPADLVFCGDALEHVEPECVDAVLKHLSDLTKQILIVVINLKEAKKTLPDGRNAHICIQRSQWWLSKLRRHFIIGEEQGNDYELIAVCTRFPK